MGCGSSAAKKGAEEPVAPKKGAEAPVAPADDKAKAEADAKAKAEAEAKAKAEAEAKANAEAAERRREATEKYVETVMSLADAAVAERPLKMSSLEFADDVAERIRKSGAQDEWAKAAFARDVATEADLADLVRVLLGAHLRRAAPTVAAAALWDARRAAILLCEPKDQASTGDKLSSLGASEASSLLRETLAQPGQAPELAASLAALEETLQELSKELAGAIERAATEARGSLERGWAKALDPQGSGRLDSRGASEAMLHGGAQGFAAVAFDMRLLVGPVREALQKLAAAADALQPPVRGPMGAAAARASAELEQAAAASEAGTLLQECVFPLAGASPLSMPVLRASALELGHLADLRREAAAAAEQPAPPGDAEQPPRDPEAETLLEDVEDDEAEKGTLLFC